MAIFPKPLDDLHVIDLCCNQASIIGPLDILEVCYVDIKPQTGLNPKHRFIQSDVLAPSLVFAWAFDVVTCIDGIEHLPRAKGEELLLKMEKLARCQIIFTPLGSFGIDKHSTDPDIHKSLWQPWDFQGWNKIVFPAWHPRMNCGAFWAWRSGHPDAMNRLIDGGMRLEPL